MGRVGVNAPGLDSPGEEGGESLEAIKGVDDFVELDFVMASICPKEFLTHEFGNPHFAHLFGCPAHAQSQFFLDIGILTGLTMA